MKDKIRSKFNQAALSYDQNCAVQNDVCKKSIKLLLQHQNHFGDIADLGCGTGESTVSLTRSVKFKRCYAVDFAEQPLSIAKKKLMNDSKISWLQEDFENRIFSKNSLDLIFCNMGLQWSSDFSATIQTWKKSLRSKGMLLFSMPISGNFPEMKEIFKPVLFSYAQVMNVLLTNKCDILANKVEIIEVKFPTQIQALKSLKAAGTNYNKSNIQFVRGLSSVKPEQIFLNQGNTQLTYQIGIWLIKKSQ